MKRHVIKKNNYWISVLGHKWLRFTIHRTAALFTYSWTALFSQWMWTHPVSQAWKLEVTQLAYNFLTPTSGSSTSLASVAKYSISSITVVQVPIIRLHYCDCSPFVSKMKISFSVMKQTPRWHCIGFRGLSGQCPPQLPLPTPQFLAVLKITIIANNLRPHLYLPKGSLPLESS